MQTLNFIELRQELEAVGAAPSVIARIIGELKDHRQDAETAALARGMSARAARREALASLGSNDAIVAAVARSPELLDWRHRWPRSARCVDSLALCVALPAAPFCYCASHPAAIVRWGLSSSLAVFVTGSILLTMHWLILLSPI
ncbi:MAG: hypothetical protein PVH89_01090 [Gammaproteobacteria bacterium]|jgi:hypothetical protein